MKGCSPMASNRRWQLKAEQVGKDTLGKFVGVQIPIDEETPIGEDFVSMVKDGSQGNVYLDLANVQYLTSLELERLVYLYKKMKEQDRQIILCNTNPEVYEVFQITNLSKLLDVRKEGPPKQSEPSP